jgi:CDGSH-type Zn-finger protein
MTASDQPGDAADSARPHDIAGSITIRCRENGPLVVEMPPDCQLRLRITDHLGNELPLPTHKRSVALCRCGHSRSRPFCDGSHRICGFPDENPGRNQG